VSGGNRLRRGWSTWGKTRVVGAVAVLVCVLGVASGAAAKIVASDGFSPARNGFSFPNYGPGYSNLSPDQMQELFGNGVCAFINRSGHCVLTPPAQRYMNNANQLMSGAGHCFGFSVLSLLLFRHAFPPLAKKPINQLKLKGNKSLQRDIAYTFQWQMLPVVQQAWVRGTPNELRQFLTNALRKRKGDVYTMAIYLRGFKGGHAVTPYAVDSLGHGKYDVLVYDNNWPGQVRRVHFDTHTNSWSYVAAANPSVPGSMYQGDAKTGTLSLIPTTPGLGVHFCPFCAESVGSKTAYNQMWLQGNAYNHAELLIRDPQGRAIGYEGANFVRQIPGATAVFPATFTDLNQLPLPVYQVPFGVDVQVTVDGSGLKFPDTESFSLIGQNHYFAIDRIQIRPGQRESIALNTHEQSMTYVSAGTQIASPLFSVGLVKAPGNYTIITRALSLHPDSVVKIQDHPATSTLAIDDASASGQTFQIQLTRQVNGQVQKLGMTTVSQPPGKTVDVLYGQIQNGQPAIQIS
jgi:hypothetical protein